MREVLVDTADFSRDDQVGAWQQILIDYLMPYHVLPAPEIPFRGWLHRRALGPVNVVAITNTPSVHRRSRRMSAQAGDMRRAVSLLLAGEWVVSADRSQQRVLPGDMVLWDQARPVELASATPARALSFRIPPEVLGPHADRRLTSAATVLPTGGRLGALITSHVRGLAGLPGDLRPDIAARLGVTTVDLLATYFADLFGEVPGIEGADRRALLHQVKAHIEVHVGEPDLDPAAVAAAHHVSVRLLYKLFATQGETVAGWIRQRRLERARHDLANPAQASASITEVAHRWGFTDSAHFSRTFKAAYAASPSDYRRSTTPCRQDPLSHRGVHAQSTTVQAQSRPHVRRSE
ncbi:MAG: helix-turn-helix domain-containing protein [Pseudonocardiaceae bacterium]